MLYTKTKVELPCMTKSGQISVKTVRATDTPLAIHPLSWVKCGGDHSSVLMRHQRKNQSSQV